MYIIIIYILGEVGGFMGLLLGASVISIVELLDLIIFNGLMKCNDNKRRHQQVGSGTIMA